MILLFILFSPQETALLTIQYSRKINDNNVVPVVTLVQVTLKLLRSKMDTIKREKLKLLMKNIVFSPKEKLTSDSFHIGRVMTHRELMHCFSR